MLLRKLLSVYRRFQFCMFRRQRNGVFSLGRLCAVAPFNVETNKGDIVHPCVRYIPEGFEGHTWWMVYTPYYGADAKMENPILCFAESNDSVPPEKWQIYCEIQAGYNSGYNSDPTLLFYDGQLYVFWRENETERVVQHGLFRATFGCRVENQHVIERFGPVLETNDSEKDPETCPTLLHNGVEGTFKAYSMDLKFHSKWIKGLPKSIYFFFSYISLVSDLLGVWSQQKSYGVAVWHSDKIDKSFDYMKTAKFIKCNKLYRPWHMDLFVYENVLYAIVQTNQCNADLCLAKCVGNDVFEFFTKPLITNDSIGKVGIYKPTAGVIGGLFYIYYTAQDVNDRKLNKMYLSTMPFKELLDKIS